MNCLKKIAVIGSVIILMLLMLWVGTMDYVISRSSFLTEPSIEREEKKEGIGEKGESEKKKPLGERPEEGWTFGFSSVGKDADYYSEVEKTLEGYILQEGDRMISMDPMDDGGIQADQLREMAAQGVDAIFLNPVNIKEVLPVLEELKEKNIPVVYMESSREELDGVISMVDSDKFNSGYILGDYLVNNYEPGKDIYSKAKIAVFSEKGEFFGREKLYGFCTAIDGSLFCVEKEVNGSHKKEDIRRELKAAVEEIEGLQYIFSICDEMTLSILEVCEEENYGDLKVFTIGGSPKIKALMKSGNKNLEAFAAESPMSLAVNAYNVMYRYLDGETVKKQYLTETFLVTKDNIGDYQIDIWQ